MKLAMRMLCVTILMLFVLAVCVPGAMAAEIDDYPVIKLDTKTSVTIKNAGDYAYFRFTPTHSEGYTFYSAATVDTHGYLYDSEMNQLASNDNGGEGNNFSITYDLEAGKTYVFAVRYYGSSNTGSFHVYLKVNHTYVDEVITPATCTEPGQMRHTCSVCGYSYTTQLPAAHTPNADGTGCVVCGKGSTASGTCGDTVNWELFADGTLVISGTGNMSTQENPPWYNNRGNIKHVVVCEGVTSLGSYAFQDCLRLTSVDLAESITKINSRAFSGCTSLTSIDIPSGVCFIDYGAFYGCSSLTSVDLPDGIYDIGNSAFSGCTSLTSVDLPADLCILRRNLFQNCTGLTSVDLPDDIAVIEYGVFYNCSSLKSIELPDSVTTIGDSAFCGCSSLKSIDLPDGVTKIVSSTFADCSSLKTMVIPDGVSDLGESAFYNCTSLTSVTLPDGLITIGRCAFENCSSLKSINLPDGIATIDEYAFSGCSALTSVDLPDWLMTLGNYAFRGCAALKSVDLPDDLTEIGVGVFSSCSNLKSIDLPDEVTEIGNSAFAGCSSLKSIDLPDEVTEIGNSAFAGCSSLTSIDLPENITSIGEWTFDNCSSLKSINLPNGITSIGEGAFYGCSSLKSINLPSGLTDIGNYVFEFCNSLTSIDLPKNVTSIGVRAFGYCNSLKSINLSMGVTSIGEEAFYDCRSLTDINLPDSVTSIDHRAFAENDSLTTIVLPEKLAAMGQQVFAWNDNPMEIVFTGDAPSFADATFGSVTATAYYPSGNSTWTKSVRQDYGGDITWKKTTAVSIKTEPKTGYAKMGESAKVSVKANGVGLKYQWYFKNASGSKYSKSSVTKATYSTTMSDKAKGRRVYCVITDAYGNSVKTKTVMLREAVSIVAQPKTGYAQSGKVVKVKVEASGDELTYAWYIKNAGSSKYSKSSATTATYSAKMSDKVDGRRVYCVVTDKYGKTVQSKTVVLRLAATITTQPKSVTVAEGKTAKVTVKAIGEELTYTWYIKNEGASKFSKSSVTKSTYSVKMSDKSDGRQLYCVVTDKYGKTVKSKTVTLSMK